VELDEIAKPARDSRTLIGAAINKHGQAIGDPASGLLLIGLLPAYREHFSRLWG
jgi:hypothetical protein